MYHLKPCEVRGERLEAEGEMTNVKVQMPNDKGERLRLRFRRGSRLEV
jgi:hypothetical protein